MHNENVWMSLSKRNAVVHHHHRRPFEYIQNTHTLRFHPGLHIKCRVFRTTDNKYGYNASKIINKK